MMTHTASYRALLAMDMACQRRWKRVFPYMHCYALSSSSAS